MIRLYAGFTAWSAVVIWLAMVFGPVPQIAPTEPIIVRLPDGNTAHLENPQVFRDRDGVIFAATRPNSGVGGLVWKVLPDGHAEIIWAYDPDNFYALGEMNIWPDGYLYYATVEKEDHTFIKVLPVPGWTP
jgi:hypothetical protein